MCLDDQNKIIVAKQLYMKNLHKLSGKSSKIYERKNMWDIDSDFWVLHTELLSLEKVIIIIKKENIIKVKNY